jgi:protein-disulfide isomerase
MTHLTVPSHLPASATPAGDGVVIGDGPVTVDAYIDFLCPFCRQFELSSGEVLATMVTGGLISLAYHPMNFLDDHAVFLSCGSVIGLRLRWRAVPRIRSCAVPQPAA